MTLDVFSNTLSFKEKCLTIFNYQYENCKVYQRYCNLIGVVKSSVNKVGDIPFLPIQFFKSHYVNTQQEHDIVFSSSGTTGSITSKHYVSNVGVYEQSFNKAFHHFYGSVTDYCVLALLPSYLERNGSSLIYMVDNLVKASKHPKSGFYLYNHDDLFSTLSALEAQGQKTLLFGVSFALLDFVENYQMQLQHTTIMDTGGMKGRKKEITRNELHEILMQGFGVDEIHSEYGMTELLSQAYAINGQYVCPPWMQVTTRDTEDPLSKSLAYGKTGGLNIIDLANYNSCSFIATQDLGKVYDDGTFEVLGRFDHSDIRGCNLMAL